ncbi:hypothetical protein D0T12_12675 [Actinomadura spongiicola]|uniref:Uncharacterized protein n=2 Tax=Actinomadura spongiicola TaxID=2303421 RepID=A0A372GL90_9ACTN|nr:hypothetical protein D0T12_12675 [Actinomadura spongiicola]
MLVALMGAGLMFVTMASELTGPSDDFKLWDLANTLAFGLTMLSCAVIAGAALIGMTPSSQPPRTVTFPSHPGAVPPQAQAYPQPGVPQQYAPHQYGQQAPPQEPPKA